ncbi:MAG: tetratricopeptide repeat protein [Candidatus Obscuribacterales bacterium]|nr:tetratricopeptide repeat protein [Candidatus Obscuribacterales bacterium]
MELYVLLGVIAGALCLGGGVLLGALLTRRPQTQKTKKTKKSRKQPEFERAASDASADPMVPPGAVVSLDELFRQPEGAPADSLPVAVEALSPPPEPQPFAHPALSDIGLRVVALHQRAVQNWEQGEHEDAVYWLEKAHSLHSRNAWLDEELFGELRSLYHATGQSEKADQCSHMIARLRGEYLGDSPRSSYLVPRLGDFSWMQRAREEDMERAEMAFLYLQRCHNAMREYETDRALDCARRAVDEAVKSVNADHWITAMMLNTMGQVHMEREEFGSALSYLRRAKVILSDWNYMVPNLRATVNQSLQVCEQAGEGEEWKD